MKTKIERLREKYKLLLDIIGITAIVIMYLVAKILLIRVNSSGQEYFLLFNRVSWDIPNICGTLTEIQVMLSVCLSIWYGKKGYIVALLLAGFSIMSQIFPVFFGGRIISVIGLIMMLGAVVLSTIIYSYRSYVEKQKAKLHEMATYDSLTGLVNRRTIFKELNHLIEVGENKKEPFIVVFIDLDDFKKINDLSGHYQGDSLLQEVVKVWQELIIPGDILGRIGGDEFALIIKRKISDEAVRAYINTLRTALADNIRINSCTYSITASFGVSKYPSDGEEVNQLLKYADTAMYTAKANGKNEVQFFSKEMYTEMMRNMQLENALAKAIENNELYLMYQPQYECHVKKLRGFEVLLRWKSEELGFVSPAEFIPVAERTGLIVSIGEWVLETACRQFKALVDAYGTQKVLSVNISALQMLEPNFMEMVRSVLIRTDFNPKYLEFEITESIFISSKEYIIGILNELKLMGIHIALDDFGTNYASLSYIQMLPLDVLKIDKSFIDHIIDENVQTNLVGAIISIAQELNYKVVAEGIERQEQIQYLDEKGCDYIQGYLWGKPLMEPDVKKLLDSAE